MIPEDMGRRLRAELDDASEIYGAALVHVQIGSSQNGGRGHCEWRAGWREILPSIMQFLIPHALYKSENSRALLITALRRLISAVHRSSKL